MPIEAKGGWDAPVAVIQRNGTAATFQAAKIVDALASAGRATGEFGQDRAQALAAQVVATLARRVPTVEQVQDQVERTLLEAGLFEFDGVPVKALTLQSLRTQPNIGHFSAERTSGKESFARFDRLPAGCMLSITMTVESQYKLENHITRIRDASRARTPAARETFNECDMVLKRMLNNDKLYPMLMTLYVTAPNREELNASISQVNALLVPSGLRFIDPLTGQEREFESRISLQW